MLSDSEEARDYYWKEVPSENKDVSKDLWIVLVEVFSI